MDHTDPQGNSIVRRFDLMDLAVNQNLTFIRLVKSVRDTHRRGFPGSVFANDGVNRPRLYDNVHLVVRENVSESFGYIAEFYQLGLWSLVFGL